MPTCTDFINIASAAYNPITSAAIEAVGHQGHEVAGWACYGWQSGRLGESFQGAIWRREKELVVGFCGTNPWQHGKLVGDLLADAKLGVAILPNQCTPAYKLTQLAQEMAKETNSSVFVTGHSLGGLLAQVIGYWLNLPFVSFNAPPGSPCIEVAKFNFFKPDMRKRTLAVNPLMPIKGVNFRVNSDPISRLLGQHIGDVKDVTSSLPGIIKHDPKFCLNAIQASSWKAIDPFLTNDRRGGVWS